MTRQPVHPKQPVRQDRSIFQTSNFKLQTSNFFLGLFASLILFSSVYAQEDRGFLDITSTPAGRPVYIDDTLIGHTPVARYPIPQGRHSLRVLHPNRTDWDARDWTQDISVAAGASVQQHIAFVGPVSVRTDPFDAAVFVDERFAGTTPLRLTDLSPGTHSLVIRKAGFRELRYTIAIEDTSRQTVSFALIPEGEAARIIAASRIEQEGRVQQFVGYAALGIGTVFSGLALHANHQADRAYTRYQSTADPVVLERAFRQAARYDTRSSRYMVIAQVNFAASFYFLMSRAFQRQKDRAGGDYGAERP